MFCHITYYERIKFFDSLIHNNILISKKLCLIATTKKLKYINNIVSIYDKATNFTRNKIMREKKIPKSIVHALVPGIYLVRGGGTGEAMVPPPPNFLINNFMPLIYCYLCCYLTRNINVVPSSLALSFEVLSLILYEHWVFVFYN